MERVIVVGAPGSGKTTVGQRLAAALGCEHVELDALWWEPGWGEAGEPRFRERLTTVAARDRWVVDGNYGGRGTADILWPRADTIVWLDLPRRLTVTRVLRRTATRVVRRTELWNGNRETLRVVLRSDSIIFDAWAGHRRSRRYEGLDAHPAYGHLCWVRLRRRRDVARWLASVYPRT